jgi:hypothetical protein
VFPKNPVETAKHIRLMEELKTLFVEGYLHADLKRALAYRLSVLYQQLFFHTRSSKVESEPVQVNYFSTSRIAVYTVILGTDDTVHEPVFVPDNCDFFIFTDQALPHDSVWQALPLSKLPNEISDDRILSSRYLKMFPNLYFKDYDYTIYIDGKIQVRTELTEWIQNMNSIGLRMFMHPVRHCVYDEIKACIRLGRAPESALKAYRKRLEEAGMPHDFGLLEGSVIVRDTSSPQIQPIMEAWWQEFSQNVRRDQLSLPFILWEKGIPIHQVGELGSNIWSQPAVRKLPHINKRKKE